MARDVEFDRMMRNFKNRNLVLTPLVDEYYLNLSRDTFTPKVGWIRPSMLGYCNRSIYYAYLGMRSKPEIVDTRKFAIFEDGTWRHYRWEEVFKKMGIVKSIEQNVKHEKLRLNGTYDAILEIDGEEYLVDVKGSHDFGFKTVCRSSGASDAYMLQIHAYMIMTGIRKGILWFDNKNTQEYKELLIPFDTAVAKRVRAICKLVIASGESGEPPKRECEGKSKDRQKCGHAYVCWSDAA